MRPAPHAQGRVSRGCRRATAIEDDLHPVGPFDLMLQGHCQIAIQHELAESKAILTRRTKRNSKTMARIFADVKSSD